MSVQYLPQTNRSILNWLRAAAPVQALAGRDIAGLGGVFPQRSVGCLAAACRPRHLVCRRQVAGPGLLDVVAGATWCRKTAPASSASARRCAATSGRARISRSRRAPARPVPTTTRWASATWTRPIAPWPARPWPASPARWSILRARAGRLAARPRRLHAAATRTCWRASRPCRWPCARPSCARCTSPNCGPAGASTTTCKGPRPGSYLRGRQVSRRCSRKARRARRHLDVRTVRRAQRRRRLDPAAGARRQIVVACGSGAAGQRGPDHAGPGATSRPIPRAACCWGCRA